MRVLAFALALGALLPALAGTAPAGPAADADPLVADYVLRTYGATRFRIAAEEPSPVPLAELRAASGSSGPDAGYGTRTGPGCGVAAAVVAFASTPAGAFANVAVRPASGTPNGVNACGQSFTTGVLAFDAPGGATAHLNGLFAASQKPSAAGTSFELAGRVGHHTSSIFLCFPDPFGGGEMCVTVYRSLAYAGILGWTAGTPGETDAAFARVDP